MYDVRKIDLSRIDPWQVIAASYASTDELRQNPSIYDVTVTHNNREVYLLVTLKKSTEIKIQLTLDVLYIQREFPP